MKAEENKTELKRGIKMRLMSYLSVYLTLLYVAAALSSAENNNKITEICHHVYYSKSGQIHSQTTNKKYAFY